MRRVSRIIFAALFLGSVGCEKGEVVTVSGAVEQPGEYAYKPGWKAADYVSAAGGYTPEAVVDEARLIRMVPDSAEAGTISQSWWSLKVAVDVAPGDLIMVPRRTYAVRLDTLRAVRDLTLTWKGKVFRVPEGFLAPGWTQAGVMAAVVLGDGQVSEEEGGKAAGRFNYLYLRMHPNAYPEAWLKAGEPVQDREALEDAVGVHNSLFSKSAYRSGEEAEMPPEGYLRVLAGVWSKPKSKSMPGPGIRKARYADGREWTTFPDGRQRMAYPDGRVVVELSDGAQEVRHADGRIEVKDVMGNLRQEFPDGKRVVDYADGNREVRHADGRVVQTFKNGTERTLFPDGRERTRFADGTVHTKQADGTVEIRIPGGERQTHFPDGRVFAVTPEGHEVTVYADGRRFTRMKDGTTVEEYADGRRVQQGAGGERIEVFIDGSRRTVYEDGAELLQRADGTRVERHADGTVVEVHADGRRVQADARGTRLETFPDGRQVQSDASGNRLETFPDGRQVQSDASGNRVESFPDGLKIKTYTNAYRFWGTVREGLVRVERVPERVGAGQEVKVSGRLLADVQGMMVAMFRLPDGDVKEASVQREGDRFTAVFDDSMTAEPGHYRLQVQVDTGGRSAMAADRMLVVGNPPDPGKMTLTVLPFRSSDEAGARLVEMINGARSRVGRAPLRVDERLMGDAQAQIWNVASTGAVGAEPIAAGAENVGRGPSVEEVHMFMMMSVGHRKNILDPRWTRLGVAVEMSENEVWVMELFDEKR